MRTMNKVWRLILPLSLSLVLLAGCSMSFGKSKDAAAENETSKIKVMFYDENSFFSQYGMLFSALYPNIEVEVVSSQLPYDPAKDMNKEMQKLIDEQKPDVLMLSTEQYKQFASEGKLADLGTLVQEDDFDLEGIMPGLIDYERREAVRPGPFLLQQCNLLQ